MQKVKKKEGIGLGEDDGDGMEAWEDVSEARLRVERDGKRKQKQETREREGQRRSRPQLSSGLLSASVELPLRTPDRDASGCCCFELY